MTITADTTITTTLTATTEVWRPVVGYQDRYEVSDQGRVRSLHGRYRPRPEPIVLRPWDGGRGYLCVTLHRGDGRPRSARVHVLVLEAFDRPRPTSKHQARHLDGNSRRNIPSNLSWGSAIENAADRVLHGTQVRGERQHLARLTEADVMRARDLARAGWTYEELAVKYGVARSNIHDACIGVSWSHLANPVQARTKRIGRRRIRTPKAES